MGQYYRIITRNASGTTVFDRSIKGDPDYVGAKLMEHSWWGNRFCKALAATIVDNPTKVCWCGDYAEEEECQPLGFAFSDVWGSDEKDADAVAIDPAPADFSLDSYAYLVNHDKNQFVDLAKYHAACTEDGWCVFPLSILTALGNGRGGGDYHRDDELVGSWAFDTVEITSDSSKIAGFDEIEPVFIDN